MQRLAFVYVRRLAVFYLYLVGACLDDPYEVSTEPQARVVTTWEPLACGDPHRVVVELEDHLGVVASRSVPCELGGVTVDLRHWGIYRGRIYAWRLAPGDLAEIRSQVSFRLEVDRPLINWHIETPR